jgi:hypothetical protein
MVPPTAIRCIFAGRQDSSLNYSQGINSAERSGNKLDILMFRGCGRSQDKRVSLWLMKEKDVRLTPVHGKRLIKRDGKIATTFPMPAGSISSSG